MIGNSDILISRRRQILDFVKGFNQDTHRGQCPEMTTLRKFLSNPISTVFLMVLGHMKRQRPEFLTFQQTLQNWYKCNNHPPSLSCLGIIPNELRKILKEGRSDIEDTLLRMSKTLFFAGYRIWAKRQKLASDYWRNIAPETRPDIRKEKRRKHKLEQIEIQTACKNPFHFLTRQLNLSKQRPTRCPCTNDVYFGKSEHIRYSFLHPRFSLTKGNRTVSPVKIAFWSSRDDLIRPEHDRDKILK